MPRHRESFGSSSSVRTCSRLSSSQTSSYSTSTQSSRLTEEGEEEEGARRRREEEEEGEEGFLTEKEVLGFAWQVAKGMSYLSDMRVGNRGGEEGKKGENGGRRGGEGWLYFTLSPVGTQRLGH